MDPNDVLREEHEAIEHLLVAMDGMAASAQRGAFPARDFEQALEVAVEFADKCHHAKEEKVLFPALSRASPRVGAEIARRLTSDHVAFRSLVRTMRETIPKAASSGTAKSLLVKNIDTYTRLLREHIRIEHEQLLPEVEQSVPPEERARIAEAFERVEEEVGRGVHEKYHDMIHQLARTYRGTDSP